MYIILCQTIHDRTQHLCNKFVLDFFHCPIRKVQFIALCSIGPPTFRPDCQARICCINVAFDYSDFVVSSTSLRQPRQNAPKQVHK